MAPPPGLLLPKYPRLCVSRDYTIPIFRIFFPFPSSIGSPPARSARDHYARFWIRMRSLRFLRFSHLANDGEGTRVRLPRIAIAIGETRIGSLSLFLSLSLSLPSVARAPLKSQHPSFRYVSDDNTSVIMALGCCNRESSNRSCG